MKYIKENTVLVCKCGEVFGKKSLAVKHAKVHVKELKNKEAK